MSIVAFLGIFQLVRTSPEGVARIVWEKTRVEVVCVLIVTLTLSEALYLLACMPTVCVLS